MRHVDEGALHAWLDGELDAYPREEAEWIRTHLETCPDCTRRLEDERAVRFGAEAVLADAPVELGGLPTLEEMRARARREGSGGGGGTRVRQLAWAASIVLAAGAGWMANSLFPRLEEERDPAVQLLRPESETLVTGEENRAGEDAAGASGESEGEVEVEGAEGAEVTRPAAAPAPEPTVGRQLQVESVPAEPAPAKASEPGAERRVAEERTRMDRALTDAVAPAPVPLASREVAAGLAEQALALDPRLEVPELPVLSTSFMVPDDPSSGVRIRQLLPAGDTLEVFHLPQTPGPESLPPLAQGLAEWIGQRDGGWLVLRGRVSPEALRGFGVALLESAGG